MAGNKAGGMAAAATNKAKYGKGFYAKIGSIGGKVGTTGGFKKKIVCEDPSCPFIQPGHFIVQCAGYKGGIARGKRT